MTQKPAVSYEHMAKEEYEKYGGINHYPRNLTDKLKDIQKKRITDEITAPTEGKSSTFQPTYGNLHI
jgi:hypothetical protein